ncbi:hypothetical protein ID866_12099 [Astraeus odoratus]|nr:hypothetical protein ID866_12099 [Astraeus odoratus]
MTRGILSRAGVDTSRYESGLSGLLQPSGYEGSSSKLRQRSLSPRREYNDSDPRRSYSRPVKSEEDDVLSKARQEAVAGLDADAYIVDMQKLARALMELNVEQKTVPITANLLRIQTDTRTCGGDDSLLQLLMWKSMAEGAAIDEQRSIRAATHASCADLLHPPEAKVNEDLAKADDNDDPNDFDPDDPNDIPIATPTVTRAIDDFSDDDW